VVRQDPDCILIGELRDKHTILAAIQAAETGHLVMGSLHCSDAEQTFSRILEFFPHDEHSFIRSSLANSLRAIMCQRLVPGSVEGSRFPATEVLLANAIVKEKILHERDEDIPAILHVCREEGMRDFNYSLFELVTGDHVSVEVAMNYSPNREALSSMIKGIDTGSEGLISKL
jgi:twitching motility protein PilT